MTVVERGCPESGHGQNPPDSQDKQVTVYKLITRNTIEENILKLQEAKSHLADAVVPEGTISFGSLTRDDILNIIKEE